MIRLNAKQLVGAWELERWEIVHEDARRTLPFGDRPTGLLLYTSDGGMSANLMAAGRKPLARGNPRDAPEAQRAEAFNGYFSYSGRWRIVGRQVLHEITVALNPAMVGTVQVRDTRITSKTLVLSAVELSHGGPRVHRLVWVKRGRYPLKGDATLSKKRYGKPRPPGKRVASPFKG